MKRRSFVNTIAGAAATAAGIPHLLSAVEGRAVSGPGSDEDYGIKRFGDGRDWFFEKRFGMFVHWGLYSIPGWHEQHQWRGGIKRSEYVKLAKLWNPVRYNPAKWLDLMQEAGMQYITITTKHHDGFCLWDTSLTDYNTMNTPYGKDIIGLLADECHRRSIPLCLYYSVADWHHPDYPNQGRSHELPGPEDGDTQVLERYLEFVKGQIRELCTNYGEIHGIWWDMNVLGIKDNSFREMIRKLQPGAIINNRGFDEGDFGTPEREYNKDEMMAFDRPTEACQSVGMQSWGYRKDEDFYADGYLMKSIDRYLSRDGNYLLNVGPSPDGTIPAQSAAILRRIGKWYASVRESYQGVIPMPALISNKNVMLTSRDKVIYVHINKEPLGDMVNMKPLNVAPVRATLLNNRSDVNFSVRFIPSEYQAKKAYLNLTSLPVNSYADSCMVVKLEFDRPVTQLVSDSVPQDNDSGWKQPG